MASVDIRYEECRKTIIQEINKVIPGFILEWEKGPAKGIPDDKGVETGEGCIVSKVDMKEKYESLLVAFCSLWERGPEQRTKIWYELVGKTIGGSELAAILGIDHYRDVTSVIRYKLATLCNYEQVEINNMSSPVACQWGIVFESVIMSVVEADLKTKIYGDSICIQILEGHRTSPDGYCVISVDKKGKLLTRIGHGSATVPCASSPIKMGHNNIYDRDFDLSARKPQLLDEMFDNADKYIALLEFKCPFRRKPTGIICDQYVPQVLSGLAVSPVAHVGLFVDSVIRICSYKHIGFNSFYNKRVHKERSLSGWPVAWGLIGVYAPTLSAPQELRIFNHRDMPGITLSILEIVQDMFDEFSAIENDSCEEIIDFGSFGQETFEQLFDCINRKMVKLVRSPPVFKMKDLEKLDMFEYLNENCPHDYGLVGVLPWKMFSVDYCFVNREEKFLDRIMPVVDKVHEYVRNSFDGTRDVSSLLNGNEQIRCEGIAELYEGMHKNKSGSPKLQKTDVKNPTALYKKYCGQADTDDFSSEYDCQSTDYQTDGV